MRRAVTLLCGAAALLLVGCSASGSDNPTFAPSPTDNNVEHSPGVRIEPILPTPSLSAPDGGGGGVGGGPGGGTASPGKAQDRLVVATKLKAPVGLTIMPDGTALVGERTTGRIVRVQPQPGQPVPTVRTLTGLDASGDGGLLDLAVSPTYGEDSLIYAYITTPKDNRVVAFTLAGAVTPVLTGIPKGTSGNSGRIEFAADGTMFIGTSDAGKAALAASPASLAGKILHVSEIGRPAAGNPTPSSPVYTTGHHHVDGLCAVSGTSALLEVENGSASLPDEVNIVARGANYGWPAATSGTRGPAATLPDASRGPGGCAVLNNRVWVTSLDGKELLSAPLTGTGSKLAVGKFTSVLNKRYGRLRTVVPAKDGALWLTTSNRDGKGTPVAADERVIRYIPDAAGSGANPA